MISRIKQGLTCLFLRFDIKNEVVAKQLLSKYEFELFKNMSDYDKVHSFNVYLKTLQDPVLKNDINFKKLALLHDCGKGKVTIFRRVKKVLIGDKELEKHPEKAFEKLKEINLQLAILCKRHHEKSEDEKMISFQRLDDE
nr:HD domain-containing protein [uncultured Cetobacterium sp.]